MTAQYTNTVDVYNYLRWAKTVPNYPTVTSPETVDSSGTLIVGSEIFLDHNFVIDDSYSLSHGTVSTATTALTETTDYTIDVDTGKIVVASTAMGSDTVFAEYKWNSMVADTDMTLRIVRASEEIENETSNVYGTQTVVVREEQAGRGSFDYIYIPNKNEVQVVSNQLNGALTSTATEVVLDLTTGLSAGDYLSIEGEAMLVSSIDSTTAVTVSRGALDTTAATHVDDTVVVNVFVETSSSNRGSVPTFNPLTYKSQFAVDERTGEIQLLHTDNNIIDELSVGNFPNNTVFDRIRITYKYGSSSVPNDIKRLAILKVAYDLTLSGIASALPDGRDGFNPTAQKSILDEIDRLIERNMSHIVDGL